MTKKGYVLNLIILLVFSIVDSVFAETGIVSTGGGTLNMRKSPDIKGKIVTKLKNGSKIEIAVFPLCTFGKGTEKIDAPGRKMFNKLLFDCFNFLYRHLNVLLL